MTDLRDEFRYAGGEVAQVGDIIIAKVFAGSEHEKSATGQVLEVSDGLVEFFITGTKPLLATTKTFRVVAVSIVRVGLATLIERGALDKSDPYVCDLVRQKQELDPSYDPFRQRLG